MKYMHIDKEKNSGIRSFSLSFYTSNIYVMVHVHVGFVSCIVTNSNFSSMHILKELFIMYITPHLISKYDKSAS